MSLTFLYTFFIFSCLASHLMAYRFSVFSLALRFRYSLELRLLARPPDLEQVSFSFKRTSLVRAVFLQAYWTNLVAVLFLPAPHFYLENPVDHVSEQRFHCINMWVRRSPKTGKWGREDFARATSFDVTFCLGKLVQCLQLKRYPSAPAWASHF